MTNTLAKNSLDRFIEQIQKTWGPLNTQTVHGAQKALQQLLKASSTEPWLAELHRYPPERSELYRDPRHGFLLQAYSEQEGLYRAPHDHGSGWVIYGVQSGEMEMGTYARVIDNTGHLHLVNRETYRMSAGESRVYLPGDIHHTRCTSKSVLVLRLTSCDFRVEERQGRIVRYEDYPSPFNS